MANFAVLSKSSHIRSFLSNASPVQSVRCRVADNRLYTGPAKLLIMKYQFLIIITSDV